MITFYTDPHLGLSRSANTTPGSSDKLRKALYQRALNVTCRPGVLVCLGDLLDSFSNKEETQLHALEIFGKTYLTLAGNHDLVNQADKVGTLQMLKIIMEAHNRSRPSANTGLCAVGEFGKPSISSHVLSEEQVSLVAVPHTGLQEAFEESLDRAARLAIPNYIKILLLHCNYSLSEDRLNGTTLNLTSERAKQLLGQFHYTILGHEHAPAEHFDGRLIILGNTHPTGMGDISDKRVAIFEDGQMRFEKIWDKATGYAEYDCHEVPESTEASFIRITGEVPAGDMLDLTRSVAKLWKGSDRLYCIKVDAKLPGIEMQDSAPVLGLSQLPATISQELKPHPDLFALWELLLEEEKNA